jgi:glycosyltransferase involved in cell wall biosynthesis
MGVYTEQSLSVIVPLYNDEAVIAELFRRLFPVLQELSPRYEVIFIDDGSRDASWLNVEKLKRENNFIRGIKLERNFGQQNAIAAGLEFSDGDLVVIMDSDLQDRPEDIHKLIGALLTNDTSMAIAKWIRRKDSFFKRAVSKLFYSVSQKVTNIRHQPNLGVFRVIKRSVIDELKKYQEKTSTTLSVLYWIGSDYVAVELERDERFAGKSGYTLSKMMKLALDRIFSFSMFPIRLATYIGLTVSLISFITGGYLIIKRLTGHVAPGWTSIIVLILFLSGINFICIGIMGEYIGRTFLETKQRPKFIVKKII